MCGHERAKFHPRAAAEGVRSAKAQKRAPALRIMRKKAREPLLFSSVRLAIAKLMSAEHPDLTAGDTICGRHGSDYRIRKVAGLLERECGELSELEYQVLESLAHEETTSRNVEAAWDDRRSVCEKVADVIANFGGSGTFIGLFFVVLMVWMTFDVWATTREIFDP